MKKINKYIRLMLSALLMVLGATVSTVQAQSLEHYQQLAAEANPQVLAAFSSFESALQNSAQVRALPDPTLQIGYFISPIQTRTGPQVAKLSLMQMFPWFGSLRESAKAEDLLAQAKFQAFLAELNVVQVEVANAYYTTLQLAESIDYQRQYDSLIVSYEDLSTSYLETGTGSLVDLLAVKMELANSRVEIENLASSLELAQLELNRLCGLDDAHVTELPTEESAVDFYKGVFADTSINTHPLLEEIRLKQAAIDARRNAVIASNRPQIGIGVDYMIVGEDANSGINGKDAIMPMVSLSLPIHRKANRAAVRAIDHQSAELQHRLDATNDKLYVDLSRGLNEVEKAEREIDNLLVQIELVERTIELENNQYSIGSKSIDDLLQLEKKKLSYALTLSQKRAAFAKNIVKMEHILYPTLLQAVSHE